MGRLQSIDISYVQRLCAVGALTTVIELSVVTRIDAQVISAQDAIGSHVVQQQDGQFDIHGGTFVDGDKLLFHSFEQFNVGAGTGAEFHVRPGVETIFSRITNGMPSHIDGLIQVSGASAGLYLINPAGVLFGAGATIHLDGDFTVLTAERLGFTQGTFALDGLPEGVQGNVLQLHFDAQNPGRIVNLGSLRVDDSHAIALIGHTVINQGFVTGGSVTIAAVGHHPDVSLVDGLQFARPAVMSSLPSWLPPTQAEHATAIQIDDNGVIRLTGAQSLLDISPGTALVSGQLSAAGEDSQVQILGDFVATAGAAIEAENGGSILIGGDYRGRGNIPTAQLTFIDAVSTIRADGLNHSGQAGGDVVIWADQRTQFLGHISAQGNRAGGQVEISGKQELFFDGQVNLRSQGTPGTLLLDPQNLEIRAGAEPGDTNDPHILYEEALETSIVGSPDLILTADNNITIAPLSDGILDLPSRVSFLADADNDGQGSFIMAPDDQIRTAGADITITAADIIAGDLSTGAFSTVDNNLSAGSIRLTATQGNIIAGSLNSSARGTLNNNGDGGQVFLSAAESIYVQDIQTTTSALNNSGSAGEINLVTQTGAITTNALNANVIGNNNTGRGGTVTLTAVDSIVTQDIATSVDIATNNSANGGSVYLSSSTANIVTGSIATDTTAETSNTGNSGAIFLQAPQGAITSQRLTATAISPDSAATQGGRVSLAASGDITVDSINTSGQRQGGAIDIETQAFVRAVGQIPDTDISLLTTGDSSIRITYSSDWSTPFTVGDGTTQGTAGSLVTGQDRLMPTQIVPPLFSLNTIDINNSNSESLPPTAVAEESPSVIDSLPAFETGLDFSGDNSSRNSRDEQARVLDTSAVLWTQIDSMFSAEFAQALNVPMPMPPTLRTIQDTLQEVGRTQHITPGLMYVRVKDTHVELVLVSGEGPPVYRPVDVTAAEIQSVVDEFHQKIINPILRPAQYLPPAQQLYNWLVRPMLDDLRMANIDHIGFILDTGLRSLPMAALHDGERFLIERYSLGLMPSAGLTAMSPLQSAPSDDSGAILAMGIADFIDQPDLEAVPLELKLVTQKTGNNYYLDEDATLAVLQEQLQENRFSTVHLATHAMFAAGHSDNSYVQLWDEAVSFNHLEALPLDAVEFLILSACATAVGDTAAEFGFAGLAVKVGVRAALASLWSISDEGTLGLMAEFYRALEASPPRSVALQQAQLAMLRGQVGIRDGTVYGSEEQTIGYLAGLAASGNWNFSHPAYWSGFTIIGNPW